MMFFTRAFTALAIKGLEAAVIAIIEVLTSKGVLGIHFSLNVDSAKIS